MSGEDLLRTDVPRVGALLNHLLPTLIQCCVHPFLLDRDALAFLSISKYFYQLHTMEIPYPLKRVVHINVPLLSLSPVRVKNIEFNGMDQYSLIFDCQTGRPKTCHTSIQFIWIQGFPRFFEHIKLPQTGLRSLSYKNGNLHRPGDVEYVFDTSLLPDTLESLNLYGPMSFDKCTHLPFNLKSLSISSIQGPFPSFPLSLTSLTFRNLSGSIGPNVLPVTLTYLKTGTNYDHAELIEPGFLPPLLEELHLSHQFTHTLPTGVLPRSLTILVINRTPVLLLPNVLPSSLKSLEINGVDTFTLYRNVLPSQLIEFTVSNIIFANDNFPFIHDQQPKILDYFPISLTSITFNDEERVKNLYFNDCIHLKRLSFTYEQVFLTERIPPSLTEVNIVNGNCHHAPFFSILGILLPDSRILNEHLLYEWVSSEIEKVLPISSNIQIKYITSVLMNCFNERNKLDAKDLYQRFSCLWLLNNETSMLLTSVYQTIHSYLVLNRIFYKVS